MNARCATFAVIDFETTGSVTGHVTEPWQVGIVRVTAGRVDAASMYDTYLRIAPDRPFNPRAVGRYAQIRDTLAVAPTVTDAWQAIATRLSGVPVVAHNIGTEKSMLARLAPMHAFGPWIDTLQLVRRIYPGLSSHALGDVVAALQLNARVDALCPGRTWHDACYDAIADAVVLEHLLNLPTWASVTVEDLT